MSAPRSDRRNLIARYPLISYFVIAYAGSWLVWATFILSEDSVGLLPYRAPWDYATTVGLGIFCGPFLSAFVVIWRTGRDKGLVDFLRRLGRWRVGWVWWLVVLVGVPVFGTVGVLMTPGVLGSYTPVPLTDWLGYVPFFIFPALIVGGPLGEEPGWRGIGTPGLQQRTQPLAAALILGVLWAFWHTPLWFSGYWTELTLQNVAFYVAWIVGMTVIISWVFNHTRGSILLAVVAHASMDAYPNAILFPMFPATLEVTSFGVLTAYIGLAIGWGGTAIVIAAVTRGRLGLARGALVHGAIPGVRPAGATASPFAGG